MIQYSCSKHASSPSLPHQAMLVYICFLFIRSALSLTTLILGSGEQSFYYKVSQQFRTRLQHASGGPLGKFHPHICHSSRTQYTIFCCLLIFLLHRISREVILICENLIMVSKFPRGQRSPRMGGYFLTL